MQKDDEIWMARSKLAELRYDIALIQLRLALRAYNPQQPRWPAGQSDGGQWRPTNAPHVRDAAYNPSNEPKCYRQMFSMKSYAAR